MQISDIFQFIGGLAVGWFIVKIVKIVIETLRAIFG